MSDSTQYLTLGLGEETFGIDIRHVHEILDMKPISALPQAPDFLLGMIDVRGCGYPVIDLRRRLGMTPVQATPTTRIILLNVPLETRIVAAGFVADRVFEVTGIDGDHLEPPPDVGGSWKSNYVVGIGRKGAAFVVVLDLASLMAPGDLATAPSGPLLQAAA